MPQAGAGEEEDATDEANTESFLVSFFEPQCGHAALPSQLLERTSDSKSLSHLLQVNSYRGMAES